MPISIAEALDKLKPIHENNKLIILAGAGVSYDSGMPTWEKLLELFVLFAKDIDDNFLDAKHKEELLKEFKKDYPEIFAEADSMISTDPEKVATVIRDWINKIDHIDPLMGQRIKTHFTKWFSRIFNRGAITPADPSKMGQPNLNHEYIVQTNYPFILTTNYDELLEIAAENLGFAKLASSTYSYTNNAELLASMFYQETPSIIHVHGDLQDIVVDNIVFTSKDYTSIANQAPGFKMILQALFLKYSILFVGYSGNDPHLEVFLEEMSLLLNWTSVKNLPQYYLVLPEKEISVLLTKYKELVSRTIIIGVDNDYHQSQELLQNLMTINPRPKE